MRFASRSIAATAVILISSVAPSAYSAVVGVDGSFSRLRLFIRDDVDSTSPPRVFTSPDTRSAFWEGVAVGPDGNIYAADLFGGRFVRFNPITEQFTELPGLGLNCRDLAFDPVQNKLLLMSVSGLSRIYEINTDTSATTLAFAITLPTGVTDSLWGLSVDSLGTRFALSSSSGGLYRLDGANATRIRTYSTLGSRNGLGIDWTGSNRVFASLDSGVPLRELLPDGTVRTVPGFAALDGVSFFIPSPSSAAVFMLAASAACRRRRHA